jgi:ankyrin repeat protein
MKYYSLFERGADINATDKLGQTVLHDIARVHKGTTAKYFIRSGIDLNAQDSYGRTALHVAAQRDYGDMV